MNDADASKLKKMVVVQHKGGYQNEFLFAERSPETAPVWEALRRGERLTDKEEIAATAICEPVS